MFNKSRNQIGNRIFSQSLLIALILTMVLAGVQIWLDYRQLANSVEETFDEIRITQSDGLATAVWNFSRPEMNALMAGMVNHPYMTYAELVDGGGVILAKGTRLSDGGIDKTIPLFYTGSSKPEKVADLNLQASKSMLYASILSEVWNRILFQSIAVLLITTALLLLMERHVIRYLRASSQILNSYELDSLNEPLKISKTDQNDEIDQLIVSFNRLRQRLWQSIQHQNETERQHSTLLKNLPGMAYRCRNDSNWTMELVSDGCLNLTGYKSEELIGNSLVSYNDLIVPEYRHEVWDSIQSQVKDQSPFELTYRIIRKDGAPRWVWEKGAGVFSGNMLVALEGFITDVTERRQQERDLEAIARVSSALRNVETREKILPVILEQTTDLLDADGCQVELIDPLTDDAVVMAANGVFENFIGNRIPSDMGLNSYIRETGHPYHNNDTLVDPRILNDVLDKNCRASSGVPITAQGELLGFLWIGRRIPISEKAVQTLSSIADIAANAIHRVDLFQQTQRRLENLMALRKIDNAINNNTELTNTLDIFLDQVIQQLHVDAARVMLFNADTGFLTFLDGRGFVSPFHTQPRDVNENTAAGELVRRMVTVQINDLNRDPYPPEIEPFMKAEGFQSLFVTPMVVNEKFVGMLQVYKREPFYPDNDWIDFFETLSGQAAIAINESTLWKDLQQSNNDLMIAYDETLEGWSKALDLRDHETENHTQRVIELTLRLAGKLGITGCELVNIRRGALLHDVGKIGVPDSILTKPGKLTPEEWVIMRMHPVNAYNLIQPIEYLRDALDIPYCHHEKWDGSGYPRGLKGEEIPMAARIFALADVWDAMTSDRYYRSAMPPEEVADYIRQNSGKHFDPQIVEAFLEMEK